MITNFLYFCTYVNIKKIFTICKCIWLNFYSQPIWHFLYFESSRNKTFPSTSINCSNTNCRSTRINIIYIFNFICLIFLQYFGSIADGHFGHNFISIIYKTCSFKFYCTIRQIFYCRFIHSYLDIFSRFFIIFCL